MSWIKENYEKAALGGAAVIALGVGVLILTDSPSEVIEEQNPAPVNAFEVPEKELLDKHEGSLVKAGAVGYQQYLESDVYSFIAFPIYGVKDTKGLVELEPDTPFHGIPLSWWKKYGMTDYQFSGGDDNDNDNDGFNNKEEFGGKTNPIDAASHPDLINKLQFISSTKSSYRIQWSTVDADRANFTFTRRRTSFDICGVGDTFPANGRVKADLNRFKVKSKGRGANPSINSEEDFYEIEDTQKGGLTYKMWRSDGPRKFLDWAAKLKLNTPNGGDVFIVPEGGEFSLPYKKGGKGYKFKLDPKRDPRLKELNNLDIEGENGVTKLNLALN